MELATIEKLNVLNREFYDAHAEAFADSRPRLAPGVKRVLVGIPLGARVLDVGCGDGKVGRWLARNGAESYLGIDASVGMIERAERFTRDWRLELGDSRPQSLIAFQQIDLTSPDLFAALPPTPFNWILAFATFHHLPGRETRRRVLQTLVQHLAPGGTFVMSNWQFTRSARRMKRVAEWAKIGLASSDVEPGDYLLTWERAGRHGLRYVHLLDETEARQLAESAGVNVVEVFESDGGTGALAEYVSMQKLLSLLGEQLRSINA